MGESTTETMRRMARRQGYAWTDEEIDRLRPLVERGLALVGKLDSLRLSEVEPVLQYRIL